jgi:mannose/cellobiose epimerase-like protein (N-acyl-D-glucosamine 2-epimerase family)
VTADLVEAYQALRRWLLTHAYPRWWTHGADTVHGGFHERLNLDGTPTDEPRRARLHPRQIFAYAHAPKLGWQGPTIQAVAHGTEYFVARYRRADGLYRARVASNGTPLEEEALLYDQAFALLGFASAYSMSGDRSAQVLACELHDLVQSTYSRSGGGFESTEQRELPLESNPHLHLLEASLAWFEVDADPRWLRLSSEIVELALERWIDKKTGALREFFDSNWNPAPQGGHVIEPGHQFEWAWLLLRFAKHRADPRLVPAALGLIDFAETYGVDHLRDVTFQKCFDDGRPLDVVARLWPQTERIKAACIAAEHSGDPHALNVALKATRALMTYLDVPVLGLWRDRLDANGRFIDEPVPASSLYHIVGAVMELDRAVANCVRPKPANEASIH